MAALVLTGRWVGGCLGGGALGGRGRIVRYVLTGLGVTGFHGFG